MNRDLKLLAIIWLLSGISAAAFFISRLFIVEHWPINFMLFNAFAIIGCLSIIALVAMLFVRDETFAGPSKSKFRPWFRIAIAVFILGILFKIQHWTGADSMLIVSLTNLAILSLAFGAQRAIYTWERSKKTTP